MKTDVGAKRATRASATVVAAATAAAAVAAFGLPANCPADVWDNTSGDGKWSNPLNWGDDTEPDSSEMVFLPATVPPGGSTITLSAGETANSLFIQNNYTLNGGTLTLFESDGGQITCTNTGFPTINSVIAGSVGIIKNQVGWLTLGGNNTFTGLVRVEGGGRLRVDSDARLGDAANTVSINTATLDLLGNATINRAIAMNVAAEERVSSGVASSLGMHTVAAHIGVDFATTFDTDVLNIGSRTSNDPVPIAGGTQGAIIAIRGPGIVRLGGTSCSFLGRWVLEAGTLDVGDDARLGDGNNDITLSGGTIVWDGSGIAGGGLSPRPIAVNSGTINIVDGVQSLSGPLTCGTSGPGGTSGTFIKTGAGSLRVFGTQTYGNGSVININQGNLLMFTPAGTASAHPLRINVNASGDFQTNVTNYLSRLDINNGGVAVVGIESPSGGALQVDILNTAGSGKLDLMSHKLIVKSGTIGATPLGSWNGSAYTGITGLIASGRNGGAWNGAGIVTSVASGNFTSLAVASAGQTGKSIFGGVSVTSSDTLVMFTYGGDANLDGKINIEDYGRIDLNSNLAGASGWFNGDFNYDGKVNVDDYGIIDSNVGIQGLPFNTSGESESASAGVASSSVSALSAVSAVPEPASLFLFAACGIANLRRRRRSRTRAFHPKHAQL